MYEDKPTMDDHLKHCDLFMMDFKVEKLPKVEKKKVTKNRHLTIEKAQKKK